MRRPIISTSAFSLVEVTLALGIAAFCLIAVFGLIPVGVQTNRNATSQTAATNIAALVVADLRAAPRPPPTHRYFALTSAIGLRGDYISTAKANAPLTFRARSLALALHRIGTSVNIQPWYQVNVTFPPSTGNLTYANLKVTWPAAVDPATTTPAGSVEMFAALDRN